MLKDNYKRIKIKLIQYLIIENKLIKIKRKRNLKYLNMKE